VRFLLDESADARLAPWLRSLGHDVTAIAIDHPASLADLQVLAIARRERRVLITDDRDFGELIFVRKLPHAGVIYLRLGEYADLETRIERLAYVLTHHAAHLDTFLVVTRLRVRVTGTTATDEDTELD
jgi:predicted nuclease of predicted toxin-antitoxin system